MGTLCARLCRDNSLSAIRSNSFFQAWKTDTREDRDSDQSDSIYKGETFARSCEDIHSIYELDFHGSLKGGFGQVVKARLRSHPDHQYAVKVIKKKDDYTDSLALREIELLKSMDHPHIVSFREVYQDQQYMYIVLELLEGGDLMKLLEKQEALDEHLAVELIWQILLATSYLHGKKIVHGDLKPENFVLVKTGEPWIKMVDFGLADSMCGREQLSVFSGSKYYLSPEVLDWGYNEKRDVWAAGIMLYQFVTGLFPFYADNEQELFAQIRQAKPTPLPNHLSQNLIDLVGKLLEPDCDARLSAREALLHPLFDGKRIEVKEEGTRTITEEMLINLKQFPSLSNFKQEMLALFAQSFFNHSYLQQMAKVFFMADQSLTGRLSREDVCALFKLSKVKVSEDTIDQIMRGLRIRSKDSITFLEFTVGTMSPQYFVDSIRLRVMFESLDTDKNGRLGVTDLNKCLLRYGRCVPLTRIEDMISDADINNDREISFDEFIEAMK
jgi:calcium-dependent protein kinase